MAEQPRVTIVLGTRPEAIKLAPVIRTFQACDALQTRVVLTGQHREMVGQVMDLFHLQADQDLNLMAPRQTLTHVTCAALQGLREDFQAYPPQLVLVQGDTTTAFAAGLAAFYEQIPVGHVEADLKASGVVGEIAVTGNTVIDALLLMAESAPDVQFDGLNWDQQRVILATVHRRENWGERLHDIAAGMLQVLERYPDTALLLPMHRNPTVREPLQALLGSHPRVVLTEPLDYDRLVAAMKGCCLLLTDSGGLQEEAPALGKPVLVLRRTTERPEAVDAGTARLVGTDPDVILEETSRLLGDATAYQEMSRAVNPFGDGHASERILERCRRQLGV